MILIINNHGQYNHRIHRTLRYLGIPSELVPNTTPLDEIISRDPVGLILGGGPSLERSGNCVEYIQELEIPILGICLGHQLIAKAYGGEVATAEAESYARIEIEILDEDNIFRGLGPRMNVWASHRDEVRRLPLEFDVLARSSICNVEAMKHHEKPVYGIQFHPEVHHTENGHMVFENFHEVCSSLKGE